MAFPREILARLGRCIKPIEVVVLFNVRSSKGCRSSIVIAEPFLSFRFDGTVFYLSLGNSSPALFLFAIPYGSPFLV